ncbi:MAG TPA: hypothetical protein DCM71_18800, partial [Runella sp.]|nr:hypothetical protein [Runella sp.]
MEKPKEILKLESEWGIQIDHNCYQFTQQNQILHLIIKQSIKDLSPIRELTYLRSFCCFDSEISDLEPLINLSKLEVLMIIGGNIENISPITNLENLFYLDLRKNKIKDISPITNLKNINQI